MTATTFSRAMTLGHPCPRDSLLDRIAIRNSAIATHKGRRCMHFQEVTTLIIRENISLNLLRYSAASSADSDDQCPTGWKHFAIRYGTTFLAKSRRDFRSAVTYCMYHRAASNLINADIPRFFRFSNWRICLHSWGQRVKHQALISQIVHKTAIKPEHFSSNYVRTDWQRTIASRNHIVGKATIRFAFKLLNIYFLNIFLVNQIHVFEISFDQGVASSYKHKLLQIPEGMS